MRIQNFYQWSRYSPLEGFFPTWSEEELGIGSKLLMKAIALVVGVKPEEVEG